MLNNLLLFKLLLTPIIIAVTTVIARRWGENIGGLIIGLPLTSGPVSVFFALEQGRPFAEQAARGAMMGLIPVSVFCVTYAISSKRLPWYLSAACGISMYLVAVWSVSWVTPGLPIIALLVPAVLVLALLIVGKVPPANQQVEPAWWDLPLRMIIATATLLLITGAASLLGPVWSGLLSPFPIFTFVMVTFSHSTVGSTSARRYLRGVLTGLFSYVAFFIVVSLLIERASLPLVYFIATFVALGLNSLALARAFWKLRLVKESVPSSAAR